MSTAVVPSFCFCREEVECTCLPMIEENEILEFPGCLCNRILKSYIRLIKSEKFDAFLKEKFGLSLRLNSTGIFSWTIPWDKYKDELSNGKTMSTISHDLIEGEIPELEKKLQPFVFPDNYRYEFTWTRKALSVRYCLDIEASIVTDMTVRITHLDAS